MSNFRTNAISRIYNVVSFPQRDGVCYNPESLATTRRAQEMGSFGCSVLGASLGTKFGPTVSFASAAIGYVLGYYAAGVLFRPTPE